MQVVWFKRDLRVDDHRPLAAAARAGAVLPLYVFEPDLFDAPDAALQHLGFVRECLAELDAALAALGAPLVTVFGRMPDVLDAIHSRTRIEALHSHEETGNAVTYARDLRVAVWCREHGVPWHQTAGNGVVRRLGSRDRWAKRWDARMREPVTAPPRQLLRARFDHGGLLREPPEAVLRALAARGADKPLRQRGGRANAEQLLSSFLTERAQDYRSAMSSPLTAETQCSRLSAHFAYGTLSIREAAQAVWARRGELLALPAAQRPRGFLASLKSFEGRLHWHCHFMQKLESEPEIERRAVHPAFDALHEGRCDAARYDAWRRGESGYPMVDACMRYLAATGWLNFRMRAMLMSFSSYTLWNDWREPARYLAREFLDYEPGIHYPQVQMQSGVTGINAVRIYNPVKQALDQDPQGNFVRRWVPALARVPAAYLLEPWKMPGAVQAESGCVIGRDYPAPIVDHAAAARAAAAKVHALRRRVDVKEAARGVLDKHGSRHPGRERFRGWRRQSAKPGGSLI